MYRYKPLPTIPSTKHKEYDKISTVNSQNSKSRLRNGRNWSLLRCRNTSLLTNAQLKIQCITVIINQY